MEIQFNDYVCIKIWILYFSRILFSFVLYIFYNGARIQVIVIYVFIIVVFVGLDSRCLMRRVFKLFGVKKNMQKVNSTRLVEERLELRNFFYILYRNYIKFLIKIFGQIIMIDIIR